MDFRQGTCTSCSNSFRVPATFTASKAKCPKCGGVVEIGPAQAGGSAAPAARAPEPKPAAVAEPEVEARPAAVKSSAAAPKTSSTRASKESVRDVAAKAKERVKSSRGPKVGDDAPTDEGARSGRRRHAPPPKKSPVPMIIGGLVVLGLLIATVMHFAGGSAEEHAAEPVKAAVVKPDYSNLPDIARPENTDQGLWDQMTQYVTEYIKPPFSTARCQPFGDRLIQQGKRAIPVLLNGWKRVDITTQDGTDTGWKIQNLLLQNISNGTNFGWTRDTDAKIVAANVQVIERWFKAYNEAKDDPAKWAAVAATGTGTPVPPLQR